MAINFVIVPKGNPADIASPKKYYALTKSKGKITFRKMSKAIAQKTTLNDKDVLKVLNEMTEILKQHLENGKIVRLGDFGSFQIGISSEGTESKEKFQPSLIKKPRVIFRQGIGTKEMLRNIEYEKIEN